MSLRDEYPVLLSGLHRDTCPHLLWAALEGAGLAPLVLGCPRELMAQGRCYAIFQGHAEAADAAALSGALRVHGRALKIRLMHDSRWRERPALIDTSSDEERPPRPSSPPPGSPGGSAADGATAPGRPPPTPTPVMRLPQPPPPPRATGPLVAAGPAAPAAAPHAVALLSAIGPLVPPGTPARLGIRIHRVWHLRFHEEYLDIPKA